MGISSHQVRLLQLTDRKHTIGRELNRLANDKMDLTRDMRKASSKYQDALSSKVLKWSSNSGVSYVDLSYNNLMKPSQMNGNTAYLLTDSSDRVVIDYNYLKYAEMISAKGAAGGNWEGNRSKILSELVGVSEAALNGVDASSAKVAAAKAKLDAVQAEKPRTDAFMKSDSICCLLEKVGGISNAGANFVDADNWADAYEHGKTINLGSGDAHNILSRVASVLGKGLADYFTTEDTDFDPEQSAIYDRIKELVGDQTNSTTADDNGALGMAIDSDTNSRFLTKDDDGNWLLNVKAFVDEVIPEQFKDCNDSSKVKYVDKTDSDYKDYPGKKSAWEAKLQVAQDEYYAALDADNSLFTAEQERQIDFYDQLFSTIAEKGWTYNDNVDNDDYLNQLLQEGLYTITTVDRSKVENTNSFTEDYLWQNTYNTDIATNYTNIFAVNDSDARLEAQVEYEKTKSIINEKETQIDVRMQNLKTEQDAVNTMIQSIESMLDENIEDKFSIFT